MRKFFLLSFFVFGVSFFAQSQALSERASISLLTGSPGTELYSTFGHSAIRVHDPSTGMDLVFNYGTFDFNTPNFYLKFAQGKLNYKLSIETFEQFRAGFIYENRSVVEQKFNLTHDQKNRLFALLEQNYLPENRYYKYDFFFDNCATRIRDLMITAFGEDFEYHYPEDWSTSNLTFRNLIDMYLTYHHWSDFGIDLALGLPTDAIATPADYMFLPDYLSEGLGTATIDLGDEQTVFTTPPKLIIANEERTPDVFAITPIKLMWVIFLVGAALSFWAYRRQMKIGWFDKIYFSIIGLVGWVVFLLWFATDHIATKDNMNVLWAVPLFFPMVFFYAKLNIRIQFVLLILFGAIDLLILLTWVVFPQQYHIAFIPLILLMIVRFFFLYMAFKAKLQEGT